jgi:SH3-like domain-containing protein
VRVDSATLDELQRLEGAYSEAHVSPLDAEEEVAVELAEAQAEQAAITATLDALAGDMHTCGRCGGVFLEVQMKEVRSGPWRNNWLCQAEEVCAAREAGSGRGSRKRRAPVRPGEDVR